MLHHWVLQYTVFFFGTGVQSLDVLRVKLQNDVCSKLCVPLRQVMLENFYMQNCKVLKADAILSEHTFMTENRLN